MDRLRAADAAAVAVPYLTILIVNSSASSLDVAARTPLNLAAFTQSAEDDHISSSARIYWLWLIIKRGG